MTRRAASRTTSLPPGRGTGRGRVGRHRALQRARHGLEVLDAGKTPTVAGETTPGIAWHGIDGLPGDLVSAILPRPDGTVWLGTATLDPEGQRHGGGLGRLANDRQTLAAWSTLSLTDGVPAGNDVTVTALDAATGQPVGRHGRRRPSASAMRPGNGGPLLRARPVAPWVPTASPTWLSSQRTLWVATRQTQFDASARRWVDGGLSRFDGTAWRRFPAASSGFAVGPPVRPGAGRPGQAVGRHRRHGPRAEGVRLSWRRAGGVRPGHARLGRTYTFPTLTSNNITDLAVARQTAVGGLGILLLHRPAAGRRADERRRRP